MNFLSKNKIEHAKVFNFKFYIFHGLKTVWQKHTLKIINSK